MIPRRTKAIAALGVTILAIAAHARAAQIGSVLEWGSEVTPLVAPDTRFKAIAAGQAFNVAVKSDGTVVTWGANDFTVPSGLSNVISVSAAYDYAVALRSDGTV